METIINVDDVSFSYGTQTEQALSHISLSVNKGDFIGIIGPSGAGKSTLAACLSGPTTTPARSLGPSWLTAMTPARSR
jgi:ABC-type bacteriocin/lantibiotic exporter with double-glycine peptidase domain